MQAFMDGLHAVPPGCKVITLKICESCGRQFARQDYERVCSGCVESAVAALVYETSPVPAPGLNLGIRAYSEWGPELADAFALRALTLVRIAQIIGRPATPNVWGYLRHRGVYVVRVGFQRAAKQKGSGEALYQLRGAR